MEELSKWIDASLDLIKTGFADGATPETKERAAAACLSLHAMLAPSAPPPATAYGPPPPEPDIFDVIMSRLAQAPQPAPLDLTILPRGK